MLALSFLAYSPHFEAYEVTILSVRVSICIPPLTSECLDQYL
jgi:hypothetical protein